MNIQFGKFGFLFFVFLTSCTSYIWTPVTPLQHKASLNNFVGKDFSSYSGSKSDELLINPDNPLGREMMARQVARQVCHLREVHRPSMDAEQAAKMAANRPPALA